MGLSRLRTMLANAISSCRENKPVPNSAMLFFRRLAIKLVVIFFGLGIFAVPVSQVLAQTDNQAQLIAAAEAWLNNVTTLTADFTQRTDKGDQSQGRFYLQRPYRTRFAYDAADNAPGNTPSNTQGDLILITTETWLHVEDSKRQEVTSYPVGQTLLKHLLQPNPRLTAADEGIITTATRDPDNGVVLIRLTKATGDDAGMLLLAFQENPFVLLGWTITDAIGTTTQIVFSNIKLGEALSPRLFIPSDYTQDPQK